MIPGVVCNIVELLLFVVALVFIPICRFIFWDQMKTPFIDFIHKWLLADDHTTEPDVLVVSVWIAVAIVSGIVPV